jgi:membrane protein implicated in regulation of membrane protease activity
MGTLFAVFAAVGCTLLVLQLVMEVIGAGGGLDADGVTEVSGDADPAGALDTDGDGVLDHGTSWHFALLSFRSLVAAVAFFGIGGLAADSFGVGPVFSLQIAVLCAAAAMFLVAWLMRLLARLRSEGTIRPAYALGQVGTVYLGVPPSRSGSGKVTLEMQGRLVEYEAVTDEGRSLETGAKIEVVGFAGPGVVEVRPFSSPSAE